MGLFSTTHHHSHKRVVNQEHNIKIELGGSTEENIKLLNEMQDAARGNVVVAIELKQNNVSAVCMAFQVSQFAYHQTKCFIRFSINEKNYEIKFDFEYREILERSKMQANDKSNTFGFEYEIRQAFKKHLCNKIGEIIAEHLAQMEEPEVYDILVESQRLKR